MLRPFQTRTGRPASGGEKRTEDTDVGVSLRDLGAVDVSGLLRLTESLTEADWTGNTFRQDALALGTHAVTDNILIKTEWDPSPSTSGLQHFEDLVCVWARARQADLRTVLPIAREDTDIVPVHTLPEWERYRTVVEPLVDQGIAPLRRLRGVVTRLALVRLPGGGHIAPHIDGQPRAARTHRIHVALSSTPSVEHKIDDREFAMPRGQPMTSTTASVIPCATRAARPG